MAVHPKGGGKVLLCQVPVLTKGFEEQAKRGEFVLIGDQLFFLLLPGYGGRINMSHCCPIRWNMLSFTLYTVILEEKSHGTLLEEKGENTAKKFSYGRTIRKMGT
jgi:hypothetical protein